MRGITKFETAILRYWSLTFFFFLVKYTILS